MDVEAVFGRFMEECANDPQIGPAHISLFAAILQIYLDTGRRLPVVAYSRQIIKLAKISSRTYHACLKHLTTHGYIIYEPSYNPEKGSLIYFIKEKNKNC